MPRPLPVVTSSKWRLLATLKIIAREIERLPEPACVLIEQSGVLVGLRTKLGTIGRVSDVATSALDAVRAVGLAVKRSRSR
jgi:hypothetical protein